MLQASLNVIIDVTRFWGRLSATALEGVRSDAIGRLRTPSSEGAFSSVFPGSRAEGGGIVRILEAEGDAKMQQARRIGRIERVNRLEDSAPRWMGTGLRLDRRDPAAGKEAL